MRIHSLSSVYVCVNTSECPVGPAEKLGERSECHRLELDHGSEGLEGLGDNNCRTPACGCRPPDRLCPTLPTWEMHTCVRVCTSQLANSKLAQLERKNRSKSSIIDVCASPVFLWVQVKALLSVLGIVTSNRIWDTWKSEYRNEWSNNSNIFCRTAGAVLWQLC